MARQQNRLSAIEVQRKSTPGRYADGGGLYLQIGPTGAKSWLFRYQIGGKSRVMGLGPVHAISLKEARERAAEWRKRLSDGLDPIDERDEAAAAAQAEAARGQTFKTYYEEYISQNEHAWRNPKHRQQWRNTLATYVLPKIGHMQIAAISAKTVADVLRQPMSDREKTRPFWIARAETADRVRGRIESILDYAMAIEQRDTVNPASLHTRLKNLLPKRPKLEGVKHHAALPFEQMPEFFSTLKARPALAALGLQFLVLTAARTSEVLFATWEEFDFEKRIWTVPTTRMKAGRAHRVPLSSATIDVLEALRDLDQGLIYILPGLRRGKPLSNMAFLQLLKRMGRGDLTAHGFRSTFRDWAAECTSFPREVVEMALAHAIENKVEAAYRRGDLYGKRTQLMEAWAAFCLGIEGQK